MLLREHLLVDLVHHGDELRFEVTDLCICSCQLLLLRHVVLLEELYLLIELYLHLLLQAAHQLNHLDLLGVKQLDGLLVLEVEALVVLPDRFHVVLVRVDPVIEVLQHLCIQFPLFVERFFEASLNGDLELAQVRSILARSLLHGIQVRLQEADSLLERIDIAIKSATYLRAHRLQPLLHLIGQRLLLVALKLDALIDVADHLHLVLECSLELGSPLRIQTQRGHELVHTSDRAVDAILYNLDSAHELVLEVGLQILHLGVNVLLELDMVEVVLRPIQFLELAREVSADFDVLGLDLLLEFQHQLEYLLVLVITDCVVHHSLLRDVGELDGELGVYVALDLLPQGRGLCLQLVLVRELLGDAVEVREQLLEGVVIRLLELVEALAEGLRQGLEVVDFCPAFEFLEASEALHDERRIRKVSEVDSTVVAHQEAAELESKLRLRWRLGHDVSRQVHLPEERLVRFEDPEHVGIISEILQHQLDRAHHQPRA